MQKVVITDAYYESLHVEIGLMEAQGAQVEVHQCKTEEEVLAVVSDCDILVCQFAPITKKVIDSMTKCRAIVRYAIGVDTIDLDAASAKGIYVCNVPDYGIDEVSNQAIALLMACAKKLPLAINKVKAGLNSYTELKPLYRIQGKTLGLMGFGRIPQLVAKKMSNFGLNIIAHDPWCNPAVAEEMGVTLVDFDTLVAQSDYLSVHCPLTKDTHNLFNRDVYTAMKPSAIFINTARGGVVHEADLAWALANGEIAMAGLDVTVDEPVPLDHPLLQLENCMITAHVAWYSEEAIATLQRLLGEEVARGLAKEPLRCPVNRKAIEG